MVRDRIAYNSNSNLRSCLMFEIVLCVIFQTVELPQLLSIVSAITTAGLFFAASGNVVYVDGLLILSLLFFIFI